MNPTVWHLLVLSAPFVIAALIIAAVIALVISGAFYILDRVWLTK